MSSPDKNKQPLICNDHPWSQNSNVIWLGSTLTLNRNLEKFKFPGKLTEDKRKSILNLLQRQLLASPLLKKPTLTLAEEMLPFEKEFLSEHFLSGQSFQQAYTGEGFILDETGEFLAVLNLADHLSLQGIDVKEELETTWDHLVKIEMELNKEINFAFSSKFGFLTSDFNQCGTGLNVTIFLHLPALIYTNQLEEAIKKNKEEGIELTGLQGNPHDMIGEMVAFRNGYTLGLTEENILSSMRSLATKLTLEEKSVRQRIKQENEIELAEVKDKVSRAYAILLHSYQIEVIETLQALSLLKLGLDFGWLKGTSQAILNHLFFSSRRAHLLCHENQSISQDQLPHKRAEFIHKALQGLELLI